MRELALPDDATYGEITYRAPDYAFRDWWDHETKVARVSWPGRFAWPDCEPIIDGESEYLPGDSFCDLTAGDTEDTDDTDDTGAAFLGIDIGTKPIAHAIPVSTHGRLIRRCVAENELVVPGTPLFVYDARPPTTAEWREQHLEARNRRGEVGDLRAVLAGSPRRIVRWRYERWRDYRKWKKERADEADP